MGSMLDDTGSSRWLAERKHILRGGAAYESLGGRSTARTPRWLSALAAGCVVWTAAVAFAKYFPRVRTLAPIAPARDAPPTQSADERTTCLDLVVGEMLHLDPAVSAPRQAALVWVAELLIAQGVRGDFVESSKHGGVAVLLYAVLMCSGGPRHSSASSRPIAAASAASSSTVPAATPVAEGALELRGAGGGAATVSQRCTRRVGRASCWARRLGASGCSSWGAPSAPSANSDLRSATTIEGMWPARAISSAIAATAGGGRSPVRMPGAHRRHANASGIVGIGASPRAER